jgi:hypothetical protein
MTTTEQHNTPESMTPAELAGRLCKDMVRGVFERGERRFIVTRFSYPVGDSVNLYLTQDGNSLRVSDLGMTHYILRVGGIELTEQRKEFVQKVCSSYGVQYDESHAISRTLSHDHLGADVLALCEAITRISTLYYEAKPRQQSGIVREVDTLIASTIEPRRKTVRGWFHPTVDPDGDHPVDYHFNSNDSPRNIYIVGSKQKAEEVVGTIYFLESRSVGAPSLAILEPELKLSQSADHRIRKAAKVRRGVFGHERDIVAFAFSDEISAI